MSREGQIDDYQMVEGKLTLSNQCNYMYLDISDLNYVSLSIRPLTTFAHEY